MELYDEQNDTVQLALHTLCNGFYTIEMLVRIFVLGFAGGKYTYLRNKYNRLDVVIVIYTWISIAYRSIEGEYFFLELSLLRAFRGLLALKNIPVISSVVAVMDALQVSLPQLIDVFTMLGIFFMLYGLTGVYFLAGSLNRRCVQVDANYSDQSVSFGAGLIGRPELLSFCATRDNYKVLYRLCIQSEFFLLAEVN